MDKKHKTTITSLIIILVTILVGYLIISSNKREVPLNPTPQVSGKLNIDVVCQSALAYMSFPNDGSAEIFLEECKEGKYPEVIERYKADMNLGDGAEI